jgi:glycosyltransferase involved in cell wall biosynthesis
MKDPLERQEISVKHKFALIIPVFNHEDKVADVVRGALMLGCPIFVVDDGSTDASWDNVKSIDGIVALRHRVNEGKGAAIMTGFAAAAPLADWAATIDADGQHYPADVMNLVQAIPSAERPIIVGRREGMLEPHIPWTSRFGRHFSNFWVRLSGGPAIGDSQSGMRLYPLPEIMGLNVRARRFQFEVEILVRACWKGIPILEVPVRVHYEPGDQRVSHFRPFVDFMRNTGAFSRLIFMRVLIPSFIRKKIG